MTKPLHIGISALHVRPGRSGSHEPYMTNLVYALACLDTPHRYTIFTTPANRKCFQVANPRFRLVVFPSLCEKVLPRIAFEQLALPLEAVRWKIDVMHYGGTAGSLFIRRRDVVTIHHDSVTQRASMSSLRNLYFDVILRMNRRAGLLVVPTQVYANELVRLYGYRPEQMRAVHHGANSLFHLQDAEAIAQARCRWGIELNSILSVTNSLAHKNLANLLRAFDILVHQFQSSTQLVLAGNVRQDILQNIAREVSDQPDNLLDKIKLLGFLPHKDLPPLYGACGVFAFVSLTETFGMPLIEAGACGAPTVASDIPVHREVLCGTGVLVDANRPHEIAQALHSILVNPIKRAEMQSTLVARCSAFTWQETARRSVAVYEEAGQVW